MATIIQPPHSDARAAFWDTALKISPQSRAMTSPDHLAFILIMMMMMIIIIIITTYLVFFYYSTITPFYHIW